MLLGNSSKLLVSTKGKSFGVRGPKRQPADVSLVITVGCSLAEGWLRLEDVHVWSKLATEQQAARSRKMCCNCVIWAINRTVGVAMCACVFNVDQPCLITLNIIYWYLESCLHKSGMTA